MLQHDSGCESSILGIQNQDGFGLKSNAYAKGQIMSESIYEIVNFSPKKMIDFCPGLFYSTVY